MGERRAIGRCEECGALIYEGDLKFYVDDSGNYFCSDECALRFYGVIKGEEYGE